MADSVNIVDDGLIIPDVGSWSLKKYELVKNYARIFSTSMKNKWDCRVYIDLYAGAGYSKIRDNSKIVQASPLLAVDIPDRFDKYIFCEIDKEKIEALRVRVERDFKDINASYINLDANGSVDNVLNLIPAHSKSFKVLCFCFVDVYKASDFNFKTIKRLSQRYMDFLILIPTNMDILRNEKNYIEEESSVIDNFLDDKTWREEWKKDKSKGTSFGLYIAELFCNKMSELGYIPDLENSVLIKYPEKNVPLYRLVFFSRHKLGSHFWKDVKQYSDPQLNLGF